MNIDKELQVDKADQGRGAFTYNKCTHQPFKIKSKYVEEYK